MCAGERHAEYDQAGQWKQPETLAIQHAGLVCDAAGIGSAKTYTATYNVTGGTRSTPAQPARAVSRLRSTQSGHCFTCTATFCSTNRMYQGGALCALAAPLS